MAKEAKREAEEVMWSQGNVFADLGLPDPEGLMAKAKMVRVISQIMKERGLSQTALAEIVGLDQPKVSKLLKGQTAGYSLERLAAILNALDRDVTILISERPPEDHRGARTLVASS